MEDSAVGKPLEKVAEVVSVDDLSDSFRHLVQPLGSGDGDQAGGDSRWAELEIAPPGFAIEDRDLPFLIVPDCEIEVGERVDIANADLASTVLIAVEDADQGEEDEIAREVYLATAVTPRQDGTWAAESNREA